MQNKRRSNGEGSYWQLADKTWVHQITLGRKEDGKPYRKSFKGRTKAMCKQRKEEWLAAQGKEKAQMKAQELEEQLRAEKEAPLDHSLASEILFEEAFTNWLTLYKSPPTRKPSTYATYLDVYNTHFVDFFGSKPLYTITQDVVQAYYHMKQMNGGRKDGKAGGLSPKSIQNHHMILKDFFNYAKKRYKLEENPTLDTSRLTVITPEMRVLTPEEMHIFMEEVMKETQRIAILTDLFTGLRKGELLALSISDFDLEKQTLSINKNLIRVKTEAISLDNPNIQVLDFDPKRKTQLIVQNTPKTKKSCREIYISDGLCELLIRHIFTLANSSWPNPHELLFPSKVGTYLDPKSLEIRLTAVSKRCEIRKVNPHALRHTFATRLVEEKTPLNIVQDILGHASMDTTRKYLHKNVELEREAIGSMSDYLDITKLSLAPQVRGAQKRGKFAEIILPVFSEKKKSNVTHSA